MESASSSPIDEWLSIWHSFRIPIILALTVVAFAFKIVKTRRQVYHKLSDSPLSASPTFPPTEIERKSWPNDSGPALDLKTIVKSKSAIETIHGTQKKQSRNSKSPRRVVGRKVSKSASALGSTEGHCPADDVQVLVFFSSLTGSTERSAKSFVEDLSNGLKLLPNGQRFLEPQLYDLSYIDHDDYFVSLPGSKTPNVTTKYFYVFIIPSYDIDTILNTFLDNLKETHHDFRVDTAPLAAILGYSVFGFGDKEGWPTEEAGFCSQAKEVDRWMAKLTGRKRAFPLGMGDAKTDAASNMAEWRMGVEEVMGDVAMTGSLGEGISGSGDPVESDEEEAEESIEDVKLASKEGPIKKRKNNQSNVDDLEDLGSAIGSSGTTPAAAEERNLPLAVDFTTSTKKSSPQTTEPKEMVPKTSPTYAALTKQGYTIIGSHSGVKICRWTKSALRGRGSCYKYSFYGIQSHLCMETTPSLSCSNKCVFCWRHGTNPVGTTWRWVTDPPDLIFTGAKTAHYQKIRTLRGVPGVRAERFAEAFRIRHCALSLVGEPIFYPHINALLSMLHA
ncbi:MAG: hypothetical protein M1833_005661, partial [Piccolia ochrophora]